MKETKCQRRVSPETATGIMALRALRQRARSDGDGHGSDGNRHDGDGDGNGHDGSHFTPRS
eukprot:591837-Ditylum_brightwellii.AAC.1